MNLKKDLANVAEAAAKIMDEALKGNQHKIDANKNNKIDSHDFKLLRAGKKPEQMKESGEMGAVKNTKGSVLMKHKTSGKEINIINTPEAVKQHQARGYEKVSTVKKEEVDQVDEAMSHQAATTMKHIKPGTLRQNYGDKKDAANIKPGIKGVADRIAMLDRAKKEGRLKEEIEQIQEYESKDGKYVHKGTYGSAKGVEYGETDYDKENELAKAADKPKKPKRGKYGARQNYVRSGRVNEGFSNLFSSLKENGLKGLEEGMKSWKAKKEMKEEADNEQFHSEVEKAKKKNAGEDRNDAGVAAAAVQGVKNEETHKQVQVIDMTNPDDIKTDTVNLDERQMTEPEMKKREEIVKSMKKGMAGFKERYGDRAKSVMYATATKQAMKD